MPTITFSRQYGSGGSDVAAIVAAELGYQLIDNEFIDKVAEAADMPREEVEERLEEPLGLFDRVAQALAFSSGDLYTTGSGVATPLPPANHLAHVTETVIKEAVSGGNIVFVGRGAQACLANATDAIHVFTVGSISHRTKRVMEVLKVDQRAARKKVESMDERRRQYVRQNYNREWEDPSNYHLCLNTGLLTFKQAAAQVVLAVGSREVGSR